MITMADTRTRQWNAKEVARRVHRAGVHDREDLVKQLGISRATAYRAFDADWAGDATAEMLVKMSLWLKIPVGTLIQPPAR